MNEEEKVEVNVEQIMREIRLKIQMDEELQKLPTFEDIPIRGDTPSAVQEEHMDWSELNESLHYANTNYLIPYYWVLGPAGIKTFIKRIVRKLIKCMIMPILDHQNQFNAHVVRCLNNLLQGIKELFSRTDAQAEEIALLKRELFSRTDAQAEEIALLKRELFDKTDAQERELFDRTESQAEEVDLLKKELSAYREENERQARLLQEMAQLTEQKATVQQLSSIEMQLGGLRQKTDSLDRQSDAFSAAVAKMLMKYRGHESASVIQGDADERREQKRPDAGESIYTVLDYFKFQNDFRGTRSMISERQKIYLPYFQNSAGPVIDIGCGRGEFLRLMKDNHISAFGVDLYPEYEVEGELNGLDIRRGDGIEFLKNSNLQFGGIFAAQVIEHISFSELQDLCSAAYEKLVPGAYLVLETPNPTCVSTFTASFYNDPTHNKPVHPQMLEYLLREVGFSDIQLVFTEASRLDAPLPLIESDAIRNLQEVNDGITRVSNLLYGSLDYAVIARK